MVPKYTGNCSDKSNRAKSSFIFNVTHTHTDIAFCIYRFMHRCDVLLYTTCTQLHCTTAYIIIGKVWLGFGQVW